MRILLSIDQVVCGPIPLPFLFGASLGNLHVLTGSKAQKANVMDLDLSPFQDSALSKTVDTPSEVLEINNNKQNLINVHTSLKEKKMLK